MASSLTNSHTPLNSNVMSDNNLLSIEEVEERIQQLLMENADLRSKFEIAGPNRVHSYHCQYYSL